MPSELQTIVKGAITVLVSKLEADVSTETLLILTTSRFPRSVQNGRTQLSPRLAAQSLTMLNSDPDPHDAQLRCRPSQIKDPNKPVTSRSLTGLSHRLNLTSSHPPRLPQGSLTQVGLLEARGSVSPSRGS
ncbi:hypothetical protein CC1G_12577 [Coprinopsis cinerea okayama7|uniref:Uncharacterized protein n=1 Tax=Coprinopsis cinerea (strain Okayama-7 / 130 / ATCC MYA-4618 / FGSC 9003) TaxID=240176 RepID=A8P6T8_COPC7|nr:hypothetical protein CC1G_12577 [Coprinopsis cinerea okayama7\|eukprot:XP_001839224.2 hypothetical protein CC1G_12577 [Coprinopsis cinerea okayama7\